MFCDVAPPTPPSDWSQLLLRSQSAPGNLGADWKEKVAAKDESSDSKRM